MKSTIIAERAPRLPRRDARSVGSWEAKGGAHVGRRGGPCVLSACVVREEAVIGLCVWVR